MMLREYPLPSTPVRGGKIPMIVVNEEIQVLPISERTK
jgi:hypothetical protein